VDPIRIAAPDAPIVVIVVVLIVAGLIIAITRLVMMHRERMEMIRQGIHPDYPPDENEEDAQPPAT
jgi:hypothetical protein